MKRTMQLNLLDKILMFYESVFFIFFATYQMLPKMQTAKILSCLHITLIFSFLSAFILFVRAFLSKNTMWEKGKSVLFMLIILNMMITVFSMK